MGGQQGDRNFNSQTIQLSNCPSCNANTDQEIKSDNADATDANSNMTDYIMPSMNTAVDPRGSQVLK